MIGKISGIQSNNKNFVSIVLNPSSNKYDIYYNTYIKSVLAKAYDIDTDYDFGSIDPLDIIVEMYIKGIEYEPGIKEKKD